MNNRMNLRCVELVLVSVLLSGHLNESGLRGAKPQCHLVAKRPVCRDTLAVVIYLFFLWLFGYRF
jgi:hypothetical protein